MADRSTDSSLQELNALSSTAINLLQQLEAVLFQINNDKEGTLASTSSLADTPSIDSLSVAHDCASLIRAHSTKVSVLIINEPFTPSAVTKVLRELTGSAIPGLASACQACSAARFTLTVRRDLAWKSHSVLKELRELLQQIPKDGKVLAEDKKSGSTSAAGKGSLVATGVVWSACDELMRFCKAGVAGCFVAKVEEFRDTLKDVMEELKEWGEEEPDDDDEDQDLSDDADRDSALGSMMPSTQEMVDDIMGSQQTIPRDDPDRIRERLDRCLKRLRLTTLLYQAIVKRRLKTLPPLPSDGTSDIPLRLNEMMSILRRLPHKFDELAGAFYELDREEIIRVMEQCFADVLALSQLAKKPWNQDQDELTEWIEKLQEQMKKED